MAKRQAVHVDTTKFPEVKETILPELGRKLGCTTESATILRLIFDKWKEEQEKRA